MTVPELNPETVNSVLNDDDGGSNDQTWEGYNDLLQRFSGTTRGRF